MSCHQTSCRPLHIVVCWFTLDEVKMITLDEVKIRSSVNRLIKSRTILY